jgi:hypothetical protein
VKESELIFIISQPRSGSTFLQNLLSNNDFVNTTSEPWILLNFVNQFRPELVMAGFQNDIATDAFDQYKLKFETLDFSTKFKEFILSLYAPMKKGHTLVLDKTPRYWEIGADIIRLFPEAKVIILKRNPFNVLNSIVNTWNIQSIHGLAVFNRDLLLAPQSLYQLEKDNRDNPNVFALKYEDLVANTSAEIQKLYLWLGIDYSISVLNTDNNKKYKGKYGDPFQNQEVSVNEAKSKTISSFVDTGLFKSFMKGYEHYLGKDFLKSYGAYQHHLKPQQTPEFDAYVEEHPLDFYLRDLAKEKREVSFLKEELKKVKANKGFRLHYFLYTLMQKFKRFFK